MGRKILKKCKKFGIKATVNTPPNEFIVNKIEEYMDFVNNDLEVPVAFCYPETGNKDYYTTDENPVSALTREQIADFFSSALRLKEAGYEVFNTDLFLKEAVHYARERYGEVSPCRSGDSVYWIDWFGDVHPCFTKGAVLNEKEVWESCDQSGCNRCFTQCFREPSSAVVNPRSVLGEIKMFRVLL